jgi:hypothetical protein
VPVASEGITVKTRYPLLLLLTLVFTAAEVAAQERRPLREARSANGHFVLRIEAGRMSSKAGRGCRATLYERSGGRRQAKRWSGKLVNEVAPSLAQIRDDGQFVVTLDEFRRGGVVHAVVVYDAKGKSLREFGLRELLRDDDWKHVQVRRQAALWLPGARFEFVDEPEQFVIALKWGRQIRIDLQKLEVVQEREDEQAGQPVELPAEILELLQAAEGEQTLTAELEQLLAQAAAQGGELTPEQRQRITEIITKLVPPGGAGDENVPAEIMARLRELGVPVEGEQSPASSSEEAAEAGPEVPPAEAVEATGDSPEPGPAETADAAAPFAGNSATTGVPVPTPNPANPVDYVAWVNSMTVTDGPSAAPILRAAMDQFAPFEGDDSLYEAALDGDPAALNSPEIAAWLEANQAPLQQFREATRYEHRGFTMQSPGGDLIGILLPHLGKIRDLTRATIMEARRAELAGEPEAAMGRYLDTFVSGAQASQGPTIIESLVGNAMQAYSANALLDSFAGPSADQIDYVQLAEQLDESYPPLRPAAQSFQGERAFMLDVLQRLYEFDPETKTYSVGQKGTEYYNGIFADVDGKLPDPSFVDEMNAVGFESALEQVNRHYDAMTTAFQAPFPEGAQMMRALDEAVTSGEAGRNPVMREMLPALSRYHALHTRAETNRRATMLTANIKAYRQQYGEYPESLDVFGDREFVVDPFTDQRFVYRRTGDDFMLYSLSMNGVDDGGLRDRRLSDTGDLVYWPRPDDD